MAPEVLNAERYNERVDVFSFAIMAWELCSLQQLYEGFCRWDVPAKVAGGDLRPIIPCHWPEFLRTFLTAAWSPDPSARPSFADIEALVRRWDVQQLAALWDCNGKALPRAHMLEGPTEL